VNLLHVPINQVPETYFGILDVQIFVNEVYEEFEIEDAELEFHHTAEMAHHVRDVQLYVVEVLPPELEFVLVVAIIL
jgi:hypothetical protein